VEQQQSNLIGNLYYYIQDRVNSDWTTEAGMAVLLTFITCGIYGIYIFYKLLERRDLHLARMANMAGTSIALLREKAAASGSEQLIAAELAQLDLLQREMYDQSRERGAVLWTVLAVLTGILLWVGYYFVMDDLARHDQLEAQYFTTMSQALAKLGRSAQASAAAPNIPDRSFAAYLVLSIVTCGIFSLYWEWALIEDGNIHIESQIQWEDFIYTALAS
jgi:hypothetical protein